MRLRDEIKAYIVIKEMEMTKEEQRRRKFEFLRDKIMEEMYQQFPNMALVAENNKLEDENKRLKEEIERMRRAREELNGD